jgi:hypothetical protein
MTCITFCRNSALKKEAVFSPRTLVITRVQHTFITQYVKQLSAEITTVLVFLTS